MSRLSASPRSSWSRFRRRLSGSGRRPKLPCCSASRTSPSHCPTPTVCTCSNTPGSFGRVDRADSRWKLGRDIYRLMSGRSRPLPILWGGLGREVAPPYRRDARGPSFAGLARPPSLPSPTIARRKTGVFRRPMAHLPQQSSTGCTHLRSPTSAARAEVVFARISGGCAPPSPRSGEGVGRSPTDGVWNAGMRRRRLALMVVQACRLRSSGPYPIRPHSPSKDGRLSTPYGATFPSKLGKACARLDA